ncbi:hypothetical protein NPIL_335441 [Nephila pilipes]|uniref:Uncharacterized protein n=1 Tax=Nephila pilipes TaxID=299642 RepID=A0A8X6NET3_NEPPI|nr:hypothetical protein NPIL_335441 [Nephila pilipes]
MNYSEVLQSLQRLLLTTTEYYLLNFSCVQLESQKLSIVTLFQDSSINVLVELQSRLFEIASPKDSRLQERLFGKIIYTAGQLKESGTNCNMKYEPVTVNFEEKENPD